MTAMKQNINIRKESITTCKVLWLAFSWFLRLSFVMKGGNQERLLEELACGMNLQALPM